MTIKLTTLATIILSVSLVLAACGPAPQATVAPTPAATQPPAPTQPPTVFKPMVVGADCESGSILKEIAAVDELTVRFSLCRPDPAFLSKIAFIAFGIQPQEHLEAVAATGELLGNPIGTGPYMLDTWKRGDSIVYKQFKDYRGTPAAAETLVFRWTKESAARVLELRSGTVDGIDYPGPDDYEALQTDPDYQLIFKAPLNLAYLGMNNTYKPFDDVRVRRAIAMGIDRDRILKTFYPEGSQVANYFTPCGITNGCVGEPWYKFDVEAARALLAEAGYPNGFSTKLYYRDVVRSYLPEVSQLAQEIQSQLKQNLNIDAEIVVLESGEFVAQAGAGKLEGFHMYGWIADFAHITNFLDTHFGPDSVRFGEPFSQIYEAMKKGGEIADPSKAEPYYVQANNAIREFVPMVPIANAVSAAAFRADVENAKASPLSVDEFAVMTPGDRDTLIWMQNAEPISLYCGDETDSESLRACAQVVEPLYKYEPGGTVVQPALATSCDSNAELTVWTCKLREGVKFHDGSTLDANDVVTSWAIGWDASNPLHKGNTGTFEYFTSLWGLINVKE